jgi:hypothetical protein
MRLAPFLALLLLLPLPAYAPAAPAADSAPGWASGDSWKYLVSDGKGNLINNLTVKVVGELDVRAGNSTVRAYKLSERLTPYLAPVRTNLSDEARWGPVYTVITTTVLVEKRTLCNLVSNSTIRSVHYFDVTEDHERLVYSPSDGRLRFPLAAGTSWNVTFNLTRTHQYPFTVITANSTVSRSYECQAYEKLPDGKDGFRIRWTDASTGSETVSWYGPRYRSEVRREERDATTGTVRVYTLQSYREGQVPTIFSNPQTMLALGFGVTAAVMLAGAMYLTYRARYPAHRRQAGKNAAGAPPAGTPVPARAAPAPAPPAVKGRGRSL